MSANPVERTFPRLTAQTRKGLRGLDELGAVIPITLYPATVIAPLLAAAEQKNDAYRASRDALQSAQAELRRAADPARLYVANLVCVFRPILSMDWTAAWQQLGFIQPTLAVPQAYPALAEVLRASMVYLTDHTAFEVPSRGVTRVIATGHFEAVTNVLGNVTSCQNDTATKRAEFDQAVTALQDGMRGLITELSLKLSPTDARWKAFGLNIPGYPAVPEQVLNLIVTPQLAGTLLLNWDASPRAARYLVEMQVMAPDAEWTLLTTVAETMVTLTDLTPGANVLLRVTAANDGGEAVPSEAVQAQVPVALAA
jgi:hypothetical protein